MRNDCHIHNLQTYLIVLGTCCIINFIIFYMNQKKQNSDQEQEQASDTDNKGSYELNGKLFKFITVCISIWGMTLVWDTEQGNCPSTLYNYAYYRTIVFVFIMTAIIAIMAIFSIGALLYLCFYGKWCCIWIDTDSDTDSNTNTNANIDFSTV